MFEILSLTYIETSFHNRDKNLLATRSHSLKSSILGDKNEVPLLCIKHMGRETNCVQTFAQLLSSQSTSCVRPFPRLSENTAKQLCAEQNGAIRKIRKKKADSLV